MAGESGQQSHVVPTSLLVLVLGIGGYYFVDSPLKSARHKEANDPPNVTYIADESIRARLWQDPLNPVYKHWERYTGAVASRSEESAEDGEPVLPVGVAEPKSISDLRRNVSRLLSDPVCLSESLLIVPMIVSGGWYPNDREQRRRDRYALVSALSAANYSPRNAGRLGFAVAPRAGTFANAGGSNATQPGIGADGSFPFGFEWYRSSRSVPIKDRCGSAVPWSHVLVLWLDDQEMAGDTLAKAESLLTAILGTASRDHGYSSYAVRIIGPSTSEMLVSMHDEAVGYVQDRKKALEREEKRRSFLLETRLDGTIFDYQPNPGELTLHGFSHAFDVLLTYLDRFLDDGLQLSPSETGALKACVRRRFEKEQTSTEANDDSHPLRKSMVEECLAEKTIGEISDSNKAWREIVTRSWVDNLWLLNPSLAERADQLPNALRSLLVATNQYLDYGLNPNRDVSHLQQCLAQTLRLDKEAVASCLGEWTTPDRESDRLYWTTRVVGGWTDKNGDQALGQLVPSGPRDELDLGQLPDPLSRTRIYSPRSTLPWKYIGESESTRSNRGTGPGFSADTNAHEAIGTDEEFLELLLKAGFSIEDFVSTVARDNVTVAVLADELARRGLFRAGTPSDIAVLFEIESDYGRAMPVLVECYVGQLLSQSGEEVKAFRRTGHSEIEIFQEPSKCTNPESRVFQYGYLNGIDGEEPFKPPKKNEATKSSRLGGEESMDAAFRRESELAHAAGRPQVDYLRRLASSIAQEDRKLRKEKSSDRGFRAIAVLGSDVYDKQLIFQALNEVLPNTLFITTDYDDRLAHPSQYAWNQNLLIASGYGLTVNRSFFAALSENDRDLVRKGIAPTKDGTFKPASIDKIARFEEKPALGRWQQENVIEVPPFRDGYQTATYVAARLSLFSDLSRVSALEGRRFTAPKPRLFEIGRSGALDITPEENLPCGAEKKTTGELRWQAHDHCVHGRVGWTQHAVQQRSSQITKVMFTLSPLLVTILIWTSALWRKFQQRMIANVQIRYDAIGLLILLVFFIYILQLLLSWNSHSAEPWLLFEGTSGVVTLALRLQVIALGLAILPIAYDRFHRSNMDLSLRFELPQKASFSWRTLRIDPWLAAINDQTSFGRSQEVQAVQLWKQYRTLGKSKARLIRVASPVVMVSIAFLYWYHELQREHALTRMGIQHNDWIVIALTAFAVILTIFLTIDAMKLGQAYIRALGRYDVRWKLRAVDSSSQNLNLHANVYSALRSIDMITYRTETVMPLIIFPFAMVLLLLVSRSNLFEGWEWDPTLAGFYIFLSLFVLIRAILLQREAEKSRSRLIMKIERMKNEFYGIKDTTKRDQFIAQSSNVIGYIQSVKRGAFAPWHRHPIVQAIFLPFGGIGTIAIVESFFL